MTIDMTDSKDESFILAASGLLSGETTIYIGFYCHAFL